MFENINVKIVINNQLEAAYIMAKTNEWPDDLYADNHGQICYLFEQNSIIDEAITTFGTHDTNEEFIGMKSLSVAVSNLDQLEDVILLARSE